jgi:integrase
MLALLSGARRRNVESIRWDEVDFDRAVWTVPPEKSKNGEAMEVYLCAQAMEILKRRKSASSSKFVFASNRAKCGHLTEPKRAWAQLLQRAKLQDLRIHDLRRTLASWQCMNGASLQVIGQTLGHASGSAATAVYARLQMDAVARSVDSAVSTMLSSGRK